MVERAEIILSCEHAGNRLPAEYEALFREKQAWLDSHEGYDIGIRELAVALSKRLELPLHETVYSRLLVDVNRSLGNPGLFSQVSGQLGMAEKARIIKRYYQPHREKLTRLIGKNARRGVFSCHLALHSFTPDLNADKRVFDIGILFDPARAREMFLAGFVASHLRELGLAVEFNKPYLGTDDGLTTFLRTRFDNNLYGGLELEVNQDCLDNSKTRYRSQLADMLASIFHLPRDLILNQDQNKNS